MQCTRALILFGTILTVGLVCLGLPSDARAVEVNEDAKFMPSDGANGDFFGFSASYDGSRIAVGSRKHNSEQGTAYIFEPDGMGGYTEVKKLVPGDAATGDLIGQAVAISGDLAFVGGTSADITVGLDTYEDAGAVWVFSRNEGGAGNWGEIGKLLPDTPVAGAAFGSSMSYDGSTLLICAQNETCGEGGEAETDAGAAYLFQDVGGTWTQMQRIQASDFDYKDYFGQSCGIDGDTLAVGAHGGNKAYVFQDDGMGNWEEKKILTAEGSFYMGTGTAISGDTVVVGAYRTTVEGESQAGSAYVFDRDEGGEDNWGQVAELAPSDGPQAGGNFGVHTALDGDKIVVGARGQDGQGAVYAFGKSGSAWVDIAKLVASDGAMDDFFGTRTALVGDMAVITASKALGGDLGSEQIGAVYTFTVPDVPPEELIPGDTDDDHDVDAEDLAIVASNWGSTVTENDYHVGNFNNDTVVDALDAAIQAANWTGSLDEVNGGHTVPEPAAMILLACIILPAFLRRSRRR